MDYFFFFQFLKDTFIPTYFEGRGWEKLLNGLPRVCESLIGEFYPNVKIKEDELDCWVRGHEFTLDAHDIDEVLGLKGLRSMSLPTTKTGCCH